MLLLLSRFSLCPTLCNPIDGSPPGSPVPGILQARTLEWVAISFSNPWKWKVKVKSLSRVWLLATSWTAAYQALLSMGFSRQEYWSRVPLPSPPRWCSGKDSACQCRKLKRGGFHPWVGKIPWRRKWQPTPRFLPRKFHGQKSLAGYSSWGLRVRHDWAQHTHTSVILIDYVTLSKLLNLSLGVNYLICKMLG